MATYNVLYIMLGLLLVQRVTDATTFFIARLRPLRPTCSTHNDCSNNMACVEQRCISPCEHGACGENTVCTTKDHFVHCACQTGHIGHPFGIDGCHLPHDREDKDKTTQPPQTETRKKKYHLHYDEKLSWFDALDKCKELDMRLATIHGEKGTEKLAELIKEADLDTPGESRWWLGGSDLGHTGNYTWTSSSEPLTYTNFYPGQPDNDVYEKGFEDHCIELREIWNFRWNDFVCDIPQYYICEEIF